MVELGLTQVYSWNLPSLLHYLFVDAQFWILPVLLNFCNVEFQFRILNIWWFDLADLSVHCFVELTILIFETSWFNKCAQFLLCRRFLHYSWIRTIPWIIILGWFWVTVAVLMLYLKFITHVNYALQSYIFDMCAAVSYCLKCSFIENLRYFSPLFILDVSSMQSICYPVILFIRVITHKAKNEPFHWHGNLFCCRYLRLCTSHMWKIFPFSNLAPKNSSIKL